MLVQEKSLPKPNIYSSKILFEQVDNRNKKRMAQMLKRKTALSTKNHSLKNNFDDLSLKESPIRPKNEDNNNLEFINIIREKDININNIINPSYNSNQIYIDIKTNIESEKEKEENEEKEEKEMALTNNYTNNIIKADNCSAVSTNVANENNNYYNTSSTNNSNNNSILYKDSQEKEINVSNLDNDSIDDIIINNEDNNNHNIRSSTLYDYDKDDDNILSKEEHRLKEENEFALKYLSSSSDSFVQLDNNLVARAKAQGSDMTDSYLQALFPQLPLDNKSFKNKTYEVTEIIKEEKEIDTPLRIKNNSRNSKDFSRGSIDINLSKDNSQNSILRFLKKSPIKNSISNFGKFNKCKNIMKDNNNNNNNISGISNRSNLSLNIQNTKKLLKKNNTISKIPNLKKSKNLNKTSSFSNINNTQNNNIIKKNNSNNTFFYSTFSSNLHINRTEYRLNRNKQKKINLKQSLNNTLNNKNENDLSDSLISEYIKNIDKPKNIKKTKINMHYIKNINNYQKYKKKNLNKNIVKRNPDKYKLNNETMNYLNSLNSSKRNFFINDKYYNSIDITKKSSILSLRKFSNKYLNDKSLKINYINNYKDYSINFKKETFKKNKNININHSKDKIKERMNHHQTSSSLYSTNTSIKINPKLKKNCQKYSRVQSVSKLSCGKHINSLISTHNFKRSKTHKKLIKKDKKLNNESIILDSSYNKINNNKNNTINNNMTLRKKKFTTFYKKIDYSYVKPKVETGLSEIMIKKLLNNNKKMERKQANKKIEIDKKQSIIKRCKMTMNKTIDNIKEIASNIKQKLFKNGNNEKNNNNNDDKNISTIHSFRNTKK